MALETVRNFLDVEKNTRPEEYDFRDEISTFASSDDAFTRYVAYLAAGEVDYDKDNNVRFAAKSIVAQYPEKHTRYGQNEADSCALVHEIYKELWDEACLEVCWKVKKTGLLAGDTMNSCSTTINCLIASELGTDKEETGYLKALRAIEKKHEEEYGEKELFYYKGTWAKVKSILLWYHKKELFAELLKPAKEFLTVAYTIGNFIPCPAGCNKPRGSGPIQDYWDLTLYCIYQWYQKNEEWLEKEPLPQNDAIVRLLGSHEVNFISYLAAFGSWDNFVKANYMAPFVHLRTDKRYQELISELNIPEIEGFFGLPKELWKGHFFGPVLPNGEQCQEFFTNAAKCIKARSELMVKALRDAMPKS